MRMSERLRKLGGWLMARGPWRRSPWEDCGEAVGRAVFNPRALEMMEAEVVRLLNGALEVVEESE